MEFLLYFVFRRLFQRLELTPEKIIVTHGLLLRRRFEIPLSSVTKIVIRRSVILRMLHGKRAEISTLCGSVFFYMKNTEHIPFFPDYDGASVKAGTFQCLAGAFTDTHALSGVVTFLLFLSRISSLFGDESYNKIMSRLIITAEEIKRLLSMLHIGVPRAAAFLGVFTAAAWLFVFVHKALGMLRFRVSCEKGFITVRRGIFTLYECRLVRNNLTAVLRCDTLTTLILKSAPLYACGEMLFPLANRRSADRIITKMCHIKLPEENLVKPPFSALFGHCAAPLGWLAVFAGGLLFINSARLLSSLLWCGAAISLWFAAAYAVYMRKSFAAFSELSAVIAFRRGSRLYTAAVPAEKVKITDIGRNIFQRFSGMCDLSLSITGGSRFRLRNIPQKELKNVTL